MTMNWPFLNPKEGLNPSMTTAERKNISLPVLSDQVIRAQVVPGQTEWRWHLVTRLGGHRGTWVKVGPEDLGDLFQPWWFNYSLLGNKSSWEHPEPAASLQRIHLHIKRLFWPRETKGFGRDFPKSWFVTQCRSLCGEPLGFLSSLGLTAMKEQQLEKIFFGKERKGGFKLWCC